MSKKKKKNPNYKHKKGGDNLVDLPDHLKYLEEHGVQAVKYGNSVFLRGGPYDTRVLDEILRKKNNNESVVIAVTGAPGTGKTYLGMALAQILDPKFQCTDTPPPPPEEDGGQIPFDRVQLMYLTGENSPLKRGQVILPDESHFGMGARGWQGKAQQEMTNYIAAIRSKGYILILIVLHTEMLDKMVRDFVVNYEIHVKTRGQGKVYRRWFPQFKKKVYRKGLGTIKLPLPDHHICSYPSCLNCKHLHPKDKDNRCMTIRAIYERRKEHLLNMKSRKTEEENVKLIYNDFDEIVSGVDDFNDKIPRKANGTIHKEKLSRWMKEIGYNVRSRELSALIDRLKDTYG